MNIKSILPFDNYTLITKLNENEVIKRLREHVDTRENTSLTGMNATAETWKSYTGSIRKRQFEISRIIDHKNSFLPVIKGNVKSYLGKTQIEVKMGLHVGVRVFCVMWMSMVLIACAVVTSIIVKGDFSPPMLIPYGMAIFGCLLFTIPYKLEAKKSRDFLADLLEVEDMPVVI